MTIKITDPEPNKNVAHVSDWGLIMTQVKELTPEALKQIADAVNGKKLEEFILKDAESFYNFYRFIKGEINNKKLKVIVYDITGEG